MASQPDKAPHDEKGNGQSSKPPVTLPHPNAVESKGTASQTKAANDSPSGNPSFQWPHWISDPNWWLVFVAAGTGIVIGWQSFATARSARAAFLQIQMMKDKERARIEVDRGPLILDNTGEGFWVLKATIEFQNIGTGRAYIRQGIGNLTIASRNKTEPPLSRAILEPSECR